ncbi:group III truncated hemoglobin [Robertkochia flava]|uniref:group III truncated hemoglobin n=1 Tax=Robertkochia flava TaxID=3447986 RepID=UPI001CCF0B01|nr:group III truncated hemoglobin [Robertkochia marina]
MSGKEKKEIENREDVRLLVNTFYSKVRTHPDLSPFFNDTISDWPAHLELLTDFWESQLFLNRSYTGNPVQAHCAVDKAFGHTITMEHFGQWIELWIATLDALFTGEKAWIAKNRARKMATMFFLHIYQERDKK